MNVLNPMQSVVAADHKFRIQKLTSSIFEAAAHDGVSVLIVVARIGYGDSSSRVIRAYQGVPAELYEKFIAARSATSFYQIAIWERFPSIPVPQSLTDAIDRFFAMQPEGAIRLAPTHRPRRRSSFHTSSERKPLQMSAGSFL